MIIEVPIIKHQVLMYSNILSFEMDISNINIYEMLKSIEDNISSLDLQICGNIITTKKSLKTEFLVPVNKPFTSNIHFQWKPKIKIVNALRLRHFDGYSTINNSIYKLDQYIIKENSSATTSPYLLHKDKNDKVIDIFIGLSENIL